jgi:hexosaminidase
MQHVEHAVFPRIDALSEVVWSPAATHDWKGFLSRLPAQFERYETQKVAYADTAFEPDIQVDVHAALKSNQGQVTLSNQAGYGTIHYTVDGSTPGLHSSLYSAPFKVNLPATIKASTFAEDGSVLAAVRTRVLDKANLLSREGVELPNCPSGDFRLRVQPMPDATSMSPVYAVNLFDACQQFPAAPMDGVISVHVDAVRLERNYALAHDIKLVISRSHGTPYGELVVHRDRCDGPVLASMPLPDPAHSARNFALDAKLQPQHGNHLLCLIYTAPTDGPLYAIGRVSLISAPDKAHP